MDITIKNVSKSFDGKPVLSHLTATVPLGKTTFLMGRSGCGKTTLLNILMGLLPPDSGTISGIPKTISAVFQEDRLCEEFSLLRNLLICAPNVTRETALQHLREVELDKASLLSCNQLSGGMKRRTAIVRAVLAPSEFLILDEPLKGLDQQTRDITSQYLKQHTQNRTTLWVTHDPDEVFGEVICLS